MPFAKTTSRKNRKGQKKRKRIEKKSGYYVKLPKFPFKNLTMFIPSKKNLTSFKIKQLIQQQYTRHYNYDFKIQLTKYRLFFNDDLLKDSEVISNSKTNLKIYQLYSPRNLHNVDIKKLFVCS